MATASFIVDDAARGRGLGRTMGEHAIERARELGYASMQFNLVVATNTPAVELWKRLGSRSRARSPMPSTTPSMDTSMRS